MKRSLFLLSICLFIGFASFSQPFEILQGANASKCQNEDLVLNATTGAAISNYNWFELGNPTILSTDDSLVVGNIIGGTFFYVTADSAGNFVSDTITVVQFPSPEVNLGRDSIICRGDTILLRDSLIITSNYEYEWSTGEITPTINVSTTDNYWLRIEGPGSVPCASFDTVFVQVSPGLFISDPVTYNICQGEDLQVTANLDSAGISPVLYEWSPATFFADPSAQTTTLSVNVDTSVSIKVIDRNGLGCSDSLTIPVRMRPFVSAAVDFSDTTICEGSSIQLSASGTLGTPASGGYDFSWTGSNITGANTANPTVSPLNLDTFFVTVNDSFGCGDSEFVVVDIENFSVTIDNGDSAFICSGQSVAISVTVLGGDGNEIYLWSPDNGGISDINIPNPTIIQQGTYDLQVSSSNNCIATDQVFIGVADNPAFTFISNDTGYCGEVDINIDGSASGGSGTYFYLYTNSSGQINPDSTMSVSLNTSSLGIGSTTQILGSVVDDNGCTSNIDTLFLGLNANPNPVISGPAEAIVGEDVMFQLDSVADADSISWTSNGLSGSDVTFNQSFDTEGSFTLNVFVLRDQCFGENSFTITINPEPPPVGENLSYIPTAFSPNAQFAGNQTLKFYGANVSSDNFSFRVFNAWGVLVYETSDLAEVYSLSGDDTDNSKGWSGDGYEAGTYVVNCSGTFDSGEEFNITETVNLLR